MRLLLPLAVVVLALFVWWASSRHAEAPSTASGAAQADVASDARPSEGMDELSETTATPRRAEVTALDSVPFAEVSSDAFCRIVGRAVDDTGAPLGSTAVDVFVVGVDDHEPWSSSATTDAKGRFAFALPFVVTPEGSVKIAVRASTFHIRTERTIPSVDDEAPRAWTAGDNDVGDLVLTRCGALRGRVVTAAGVLMDPAFIELYPVSNGRRTGSKTARGEFRFGELPPDSYKIGVRATGWLSHTTEPIVVRFGETTTVPDIVLSQAPSIRGVVVDETGAGVPGLRIEGSAPSKGETSSTTTRAGGTFTLLLCADEPTSIRVRGTQIEFENSGGETTAAPGAEDVRIVLKRLPRMHFLVVDETRAPVERFSIKLSKASAFSNISYDGFDDRTLADHPRGEWSSPLRGADTVVVLAPQCAPAKRPIVADAGTSDVQTIQLEPAAVISGRVRLDGRPFPGSSIRLRSYDRERGDGNGPQEESLRTERTLLAGADGEFEFDELRAGPYVIDVSGLGASPLTLPRIVVARGQALNLSDLDVSHAAIVRGVVLTRPGESPVGFRVKLDGHIACEISNADGRFEFRDLPVGAHSLVWSRAGENEAFVDPARRSAQFELGPGEVRELVIDARDSAPCSLTLRVLRNGRPASGVQIYATYLGAAQATWGAKLCETDADGVATAVLDAGLAVRIDVRDGESHVLGGSDRTIELVPGGRVDDTIELATGTIVVDLPTTLLPEKDGQVSLWFENFAQPPAFACARGSAWSCPREWSSSTVDFGEFAAGSYQVTVACTRRLPPEQVMRKPAAPLAEPLHEPYTVRIEVRSGAVTRIVVP